MKKRRIAAVLLAALTAGLLPGCGEKESNSAQQAQNNGAAAQDNSIVAAKFVYQAEYQSIGLGEAYELSYITDDCVSGKYLFFGGSCVTGTTEYMDEATGETVTDQETGEPVKVDVYETLLFRMDLNTGETARLEGYQPAEIPEGQLGSSSIAAIAPGPDGTIWLLESVNTYSYKLPENFDAETDEAWNYYVPGESVLSMRQYDADGHELKSVALPDLEYIYPQEVLVDQAGNIYISTYDTIYLLDTEGTLLAQIANSSWGALCQISASEIGTLAYDFESGKRIFQRIDPETKDYGDTLELPFDTQQVYSGFENYQYLYDDGISVYGVDCETGEAEKLFAWLDCDVSSDSIESFSILEDGRIVALSKDNTQEPVKYELLRMEQVDASTLPQKQELTLACINFSQEIRAAVLNFNRSHQDVRIVVKDYSEYNTDEEYAVGLTKLNTEILSGAVPDILCTSALPSDQYAAKGLLMDLWPLIDGDESLNREDLMTHLFDVMSTDGQLYQLPSSFSIMTVVGNADVTGDRTSWTLDELMGTLETMPEGATIFGEYDTKDSILRSCVNQNIGSYIDWEAQTCSFDSQAFIDVLNFANSFPAEFDWDSYDWETAEGAHSRFMNGKQLLMEAWISDFAYMQLFAAMVGGNPAYVGYPTATGAGSVFNIAGNTFAITTGCKDVDLAWSFVRTFLTEEYQNSLSFAFPVNRHAFEALAEKAMTPDYKMDPETGEQVEVSHSSWSYDDLELEIMAMTQEQLDQFLRLYESCGSVFTNNNTVYQIIEEETAAFFDGQKTAEETAKLIQDRVGLYVMEQG